MFNSYKDVVTVKDLAAMLGIGRSMAYRLIKYGSIKHIRIGKTIKVPKIYLEEFIEKSVDYTKKSCYNDGITTGLPSKEEVKT